MPKTERRNWIVVGFEDPTGEGFSPVDVTDVFDFVRASLDAKGISARARIAFSQQHKPFPAPVVVITADGVPVAVVSKAMREVLEPGIRDQIDQETGTPIKRWGSLEFVVDDAGDDDA